MRRKSAFSLIELSIVLIIVGLLIAGVTTGASLIQSSQLRSVITEARTWQIAVTSFHNQFDSLPGDYGTSVGSAFGGGNENGIIDYYSDDNAFPESRLAWTMLIETNLIDLAVAPAAIAVSDPVTDVEAGDFGDVLPASRISSAGWDFDYDGNANRNVVVLTGRINGGIEFNLASSGDDSYASPAISATDALSLDSKFDDGVANEGIIKGVLTACNTGGVYETAAGDVCALSYVIDENI